MQRQNERLVLSVEIVEDERQLDGSRHIELVGEQQAVSGAVGIALRLVFDRDGVVAESELNLEHGEAFEVISFEPSDVELAGELLELSLRTDRAELELMQAADGGVELTLCLLDEAAR